MKRGRGDIRKNICIWRINLKILPTNISKCYREIWEYKSN